MVGARRWVHRILPADEPARTANANIAWLVLLALAGAAVTWFRVEHLTEAATLYGYEPSGLVRPVWVRPEFAADFPGGEANTLGSLAGQAYRILGFLPLSKHVIVSLMIFAEFCTLAAGAFFASRAVDRSAPAWIGLATALLLTTGVIVNADLARWNHPLYGYAYVMAYGLGLLGFAAILSQRPIAAGLAIGVAGAIHPIITLFFGLAMGVAALLDLRRLGIVRLAVGGALAALIAGGWTLAMYGGSDVAVAEVDPAFYIDMVRLMNYHWFPFTLGVFGQVAYERLMPFVGFLVLFVSLLDLRAPKDRQVAAAVGLLVLVAIAGAVLSESGNPLVIKLALHRASLIALFIAATLVVPRLLAAAVSGSSARATLSAVLLLETYFRANGVPVWLCLLFAFLVIFEEREQGWKRLRWPGAAIVVAGAVIVAVAASGWTPSVTTEPTIGLDTFFKPLFLAALTIALAARYLRQPALLAGAFLLAALPWTPAVSPINANALDQARAYLGVQEWARDNTASDALFMTDPGHAYGWRENSERPSFGTSREWLFTGWGYDTRADMMREGLRRAASLGLDVRSYIELDRTDPGNAKNILSMDATRLYHEKDADWFRTMAAEYGIDYFVFDKQQSDHMPSLPVAFENQRYAILAPAR